jgi:hypothetical protein
MLGNGKTVILRAEPEESPGEADSSSKRSVDEAMRFARGFFARGSE